MSQAAPPRSLTRSIDGDANPRGRARAIYLLQGLADLASSLCERRGAEPLRLSGREIDEILSLRGGNRRVTSQRMYFRRVCVTLRRAAEGRELQVLDAGCGSGAYGDVFKKCLPGSAYVGVDIRPSAGWERELAKTDGLRREFLALDLSTMRLPWEARFDLVVSFSALEHFSDVRAAAAELFRVTRPGGRHVHAVPSHWSLFSYWMHGYRRFSPGSLRHLFEEAGFRGVEIVSLGGAFTFVLDKLFVHNPLLIQAKLRGFPGPLERGTRAHARLLPAALRLDRVLPRLANTYVLTATKP